MEKLAKSITTILSTLYKAPYWFIMRALYRGLGIRYYYTLKQSIGPSCALYKRAKKSILIVSGELNPDLFASASFKRGLSRLADTEGVTVKILCGPDPDEKTLAVLKPLIQRPHSNISLGILGTRPDVHFSVVDGTHVRIEDPHEEYATEKTGYVSFDTPRLGKQLAHDFRELERKATPYKEAA